MRSLENFTVAILTENGFEEVELTSPKQALENTGATVHVLSPQGGKVRAWNKNDWGIEVEVDKDISEADPKQYDALLLPGGVMNPDKLRMNEAAVRFVSQFLNSNKPVAAICHGPQVLIETGKLKGRRMTSYPSLRTDLENAGAEWEDKEVCQDDNLITSRKPDDIPAFNKKIVEEFGRMKHDRA